MERSLAIYALDIARSIRLLVGAILHQAPHFYEAICLMWVNKMQSSSRESQLNNTLFSVVCLNNCS